MKDDMKRSDNSSNLNITSYPASRYRPIIASRRSSDMIDNTMRNDNYYRSNTPPYHVSSSGSTSMSERSSDSKEHERNENNSSLIPSPSGTIGGYMSLFGARIPATPPADLYFEQTKKMKFSEEVEVSPLYRRYMEADYMHGTSIDYNDPFAVTKWMDELNSAKFGSVTKEIDDFRARNTESMRPYFRRHPALSHGPMDWTLPRDASRTNKPPNVIENPHANYMAIQHVNYMANQAINVMINQPVSVAANQPVNFAQDMVVFNGNAAFDMNTVQPNQRPFQPYKEIVLNKPAGVFLMKQFWEGDNSQDRTVMGVDTNIAAEPKRRKGKRVHESPKEEIPKDKSVCQNVEEEIPKDESVCQSVEEERPKNKGVYVGVEDDTESEESNGHLDANFDGLGDIWQEMSVALECSKDTSTSAQPLFNENTKDSGEECEHSFILKDDLGYVCRICGVIGKGIETIIEFQHPKGTKNTRTSWYEGRTSKDKEAAQVSLDGMRGAQEFSVSEINAHPRHRKQMKPHQVEGFNFLVNNLVTDNPGGCILAHAPGSGKTFMLISFIQSFMAKYPLARPLVVLPRGILPTWKKEFKRWQIENFPLYDFYSVKAESRTQQLEVLKQWVEDRSILFLGYKQFSSIVCDNDMGITSATCQEILLTYPSILILDEGHTPRNQDTDVLTSLEKVQTPRKVVLSGTLYQNHVKEVFNILNLVRPKFLRLETSKAIKKRILSRVPISSRRNVLKKGTDNEFYDLVEHTLVKDDNFKRKVMVIEDLREMTSKVLHYYKGDFLDELPGLVDFSVFLNLSHNQKQEVTELRKLSRKFKISSDGSAIYVHPELKSLAANTTSKERIDELKIDALLEKVDEREGVKAKFFLNLLRLCESAGEKILVFGQYLLPLKFLERLTMKLKGWSPGKEIFMITGDSDSDFRELSMDRFNNSPDAKVFFGSIKACGEGISLVGASRIIILDVHLNPSVTRQAIGRAFRPGQVKKVYTYRLVAADSPEAEDHATCFKKESISKMWFEWNEFCGHHDFEMETAVVTDCGDQFLETPFLNEDIAALYKR